MSDSDPVPARGRPRKTGIDAVFGASMRACRDGDPADVSAGRHRLGPQTRTRLAGIDPARIRQIPSLALSAIVRT